jgi:hypothetical protein
MANEWLRHTDASPQTRTQIIHTNITCGLGSRLISRLRPNGLHPASMARSGDGSLNDLVRHTKAAHHQLRRTKGFRTKGAYWMLMKALRSPSEARQEARWLTISTSPVTDTRSTNTVSFRDRPYRHRTGPAVSFRDRPYRHRTGPASQAGWAYACLKGLTDNLHPSTKKPKYDPHHYLDPTDNDPFQERLTNVLDLLGQLAQPERLRLGGVVPR